MWLGTFQMLSEKSRSYLWNRSCCNQMGIRNASQRQQQVWNRDRENDDTVTTNAASQCGKTRHSQAKKYFEKLTTYLVTFFKKSRSWLELPRKFCQKSTRADFSNFNTVGLLETWISTTCCHVGGNRSQMPLF